MKNPSHWIAPPTRPPTAMGDARHPRRDLGHRALSGLAAAMAPAKTIATRFACTLAPHASFSFARFPGFTFITVQHRPQWNLNAHGARPDSAAHVGPARQRPPVGRSSTTVTRIPDSDVEKPGSSGSVSSTGRRSPHGVMVGVAGATAIGHRHVPNRSHLTPVMSAEPVFFEFELSPSGPGAR